MRKQLRSLVIASAALMMLAIPPSWAAPGGNPDPNCKAPGQANSPPCNQAPEIDIGAGSAGLTVLAITLLLAAERRSRSS